MSLYTVAKSVYRSVVPRFLNEVIFGGNSAISRSILNVKGRLEQNARHDDIYDAAYYQHYSDGVAKSAKGIVLTIMRDFTPQSVTDIGCGSGEILAEFKSKGVKTVGLDLSEAALAACRKRGLYVERFDLESRIDPDQYWISDLAISTEVAEHIPEQFADAYVKLLCILSRKNIVMTAAVPGQGGTDHVNERPNSYWIDKFEKIGAGYLRSETVRYRKEWVAMGVDSARANNVMLFEHPLVRAGR